MYLCVSHAWQRVSRKEKREGKKNIAELWPWNLVSRNKKKKIILMEIEFQMVLGFVRFDFAVGVWL